MAATLTTAPAAKVMSADPTFVTLTTNEVPAGAATVTLAFSSTGPAATQTLRLQYAGNDQTFTVVTTDGESAFDLPVIGALSLSDYAIAVAERLAQNEALHQYFSIAASGSSVVLTQRVLAVVDITATSTLANTTVTVADVTAVTQAYGLSALVQVWRDTGALATDQLLLSAHAPYNLANQTAQIDIHPAFGILRPHRPDESSIDFTAVISLPSGIASAAALRYYLRYADKSGIPAVPTALLRSSTYMAIYGSIAADSGYTAATSLRHAYRRRDGATFIKPVTDVQPDWIYWLPPTGVTSIYLNVLVEWSDGTSSSYDPYGTSGTTVADTNLYWFVAGYKQLKLAALTPPGGTDPDAYITGYTVTVRRTDGLPMLGTHSAKYSVLRQGDWPALYLLFDNGLGGCESVGLRGKTQNRYQSRAETFKRPRTNGWTNADGDSGIYAAEGNRSWTANTGWLTDPYYLEHLRQLPLSQAWLIDVANKKFRKVVVSTGDIEVGKSDETLYNIPFTITAAWTDQAANV